MQPFQTLTPIRIYLGTQSGQQVVTDSEKNQLHHIFSTHGIKTYAWIESPSFFEGGFEASLQIGFSVTDNFGFQKDRLSGSAEKLITQLLTTFDQFAVGVEMDGVYARYSNLPS
jgi:hypothetical protein